VHRVAALVRLHESSRALEYAQSIDTTLVGTLPPERKANYLLDLTQALIDVGRYSEAVQMLSEAEHITPGAAGSRHADVPPAAHHSRLEIEGEVRVAEREAPAERDRHLARREAEFAEAAAEAVPC